MREKWGVLLMSDSFVFFLKPKSIWSLLYLLLHLLLYVNNVFIKSFGPRKPSFLVFFFFNSLSEIIFLLVWLVLQKPPISAIIAVVDWCRAIHSDSGWFSPHLWHNVAHTAARNVSVCIIKIYFLASMLIFSLYGLLLFIQYNLIICTAKRKL